MAVQQKQDRGKRIGSLQITTWCQFLAISSISDKNKHAKHSVLQPNPVERKLAERERLQGLDT